LKLRGDEWTRKWRALPREQRRRIVRAVARGEAVVDPRDAALAVELIDRRQRRMQSARTRWFSKLLSRPHLAIVACFAIVGVVFTRDYLVIGLTLLSALNFAISLVSVRRVEKKAALARQKNEQLAQL